MNVQTYYNEITHDLELLCSKIKTNGKLNILDLNIHAETFYRDLLNLLFDWDLESANLNSSNTEAIDLISTKNKIICQVSSTASKQKIENTLSKDAILQYKSRGFRLVFVFIADFNESLKNSIFKNPHGISFNSEKDLYDKKSVVTAISQLSIDKYLIVRDFFKKHFNKPIRPEQLKNNLSLLVNIIASENLSDIKKPKNLNEFNIDEKIEFNDLSLIKETTIDEFKIYFNKLESIYKAFDAAGANKRISVLTKIASFYEYELTCEKSNVQRFFSILENTKTYILKSSPLISIEEDLLEMCIKIIIVDAFIRCKIFKNPKEYSYVTSV